MKKSVKQSLIDCFLMNRPAKRPRRKVRRADGRPAVPIRKVRSPITQAALEVLRLRRGEALPVGTIVQTMEFRHPGILKGTKRERYNQVHSSLSRVMEVRRDKGRFWLEASPL